MSFTPYSGLGLLSAAVRHKLFVSYYHWADQHYRDVFEKAFGHLFISKSVQPAYSTPKPPLIPIAKPPPDAMCSGQRPNVLNS